MQDLRSPTTFVKELAQKEEHLAKILDIPPIPSEPIPITTDTSIPPSKPKFYYPLNYMNSMANVAATITSDVKNGDLESSKSSATLPLHKIHLINDEEQEDEDEAESCDEIDSTPKMHNLMTINHGELGDGLPKVQKMPKFMKIPNLWDIKIEKCESTDDDEDGSGSVAGPLTGSDCSEWEFL